MTSSLNVDKSEIQRDDDMIGN